ncbi:MAG: hypothetical protein KIS66_16930 [Fimbriimonadaceae bacterium]|nr:hypothetical protein [Fimbriimonadaceae bacterium]
MKNRLWLLALIPVVLAIVVVAGARQLFARPNLATLTRKANADLRQGRVAEATAMFADIASRDPGNGAAWFRLGYAHHTARAYREAIGAYEKSYALHWIPGTTAYNLACAHALAGNEAAALKWLERSMQDGFRDARLLATDPDLDPLRNTAGYRSLEEKFDRTTKNAGLRALEPLIGPWDAYDGKGILVGTVEFRSLLTKSAVQQVASLPGRTRQVAMFYYNAQAGLWKQVEASDDGSFVERVAKPQSDGLRFEGWAYPVAGSNTMDRVVLREAGGAYRLRNETSADSGRNWTTILDVELRRRQNAPKSSKD